MAPLSGKLSVDRLQWLKHYAHNDRGYPGPFNIDNTIFFFALCFLLESVYPTDLELPTNCPGAG